MAIFGFLGGMNLKPIFPLLSFWIPIVKKKHMIILFGTECIIEIPIIENFVLKFLNELFGGFLLLSAITHFSYAEIHGSGIGP